MIAGSNVFNTKSSLALFIQHLFRRETLSPEYIFKNNLRNIDDYEVFKELPKVYIESICAFNSCKVVINL